MSWRWTTAPLQSYTLLGRLGLDWGTWPPLEELLVTSHESPDLGLELDMVSILNECQSINITALFVLSIVSEMLLLQKQNPI